jgi:hypothetical protein
MALLERHEVASLVVGLAVNPASMDDANPREGEGSKRGSAMAKTPNRRPSDATRQSASL